MKIINEKGIPFGLLSASEQDELRQAYVDGAVIECYLTEGNWCETSQLLWNISTSYRAIIKEKKSRALTIDDFDALGVVRVIFVDRARGIEYVDKRGLQLWSTRYMGWDEVMEGKLQGITYKGTKVNLWKEEAE